MQNLIVSLNENTLKLSAATPQSIKSKSAELDNNVAHDSSILDVKIFSDVLFNLIKEVTADTRDKKFDLTFLVEPQDVLLKFITVGKKTGNLDETILAEVKSKLLDVTLEDLYFSYQKIAPFVYQFVGINKEKVEKYLEVSNTLGIELRSIIPWVLLLPKFVGKNEPSIFISKSSGDQVVALSELNGIYFCEVYEKEKSSKEIEALVAQLSVYKRTTPITRIYTLNDGAFSLDPQFEIVPIIPKEEIPEQMVGYELHGIFNKVSNEDNMLLSTQVNLLNLMPLPVVEHKVTSVAVVGGALAALLIVGGGIFFFVNKNNGSLFGQQGSSQNTEVLSESDTPQLETTPSVQEKPVLNKSDIKIRIENAAGIPGLAAKTQTFLQDKGYTVPEIETADTQRADTLIKIKASKKDYLEMLVADMKDSYQTVTEETLDEASTYDVLVQTGTK